MENPFNDEYFMNKALQQAQFAFENNEVPIGAVVVHNHTIIGKGFNQVEQLQDATAHAEMIALTAACGYVGSKFLKDCTLYVTVEPCVMCAGAIALTRVKKVVFGIREPNTGILDKYPQTLNKIEIVGGIEALKAKELMQDFFRAKREIN